jgi:hypothetical protein
MGACALPAALTICANRLTLLESKQYQRVDKKWAARSWPWRQAWAEGGCACGFIVERSGANCGVRVVLKLFDGY